MTVASDDNVQVVVNNMKAMLSEYSVILCQAASLAT